MSTVVYTDVGRVARALAFQAPEFVAGGSSLSEGDTQIQLNQNVPDNWQIGTSLGVDVNNQTLFEIVQIIAIPSNTQITVTPFTQNHASGTPIVNVTAVLPYISAASRWFDTTTFFSSGFAYEPITDKKTAYVDNDGFITVPLSKPIVKMEDISNVTFQTNPLEAADPLDITKAWIEDNYFLKIAPTNSYSRRTGLATVTYSGGYSPVPDDIVQAVTVMAARMYKERDSGYSDVIASAETGLLQYKKAAPADVQVVINKYRRWTE